MVVAGMVIHVLALVTGVAGFIGSQLAEHLRLNGWTVRGVDSFTPYYDPVIKAANVSKLRADLGFEFVDADVRTAMLEPLLDGVDAVFHFAAQPGVHTSWEEFATYNDHNVVATQRLLQAARHRPPGRLVFASSSSVYGQSATAVDELAPTRPFSPYGVTKLAAESLCRAYAENFGLSTVVLRLFTVYGPRQRPDMAFHRLIRAALCGEPFTVFGDGSQARDFTYVDDVVEASRRAAELDLPTGSVFNISGGGSCTVREAIELVGRIAATSVPVEYLPDRPGDVHRTEADIERAASLLGWSPRTDLVDGITQQIDDVRRHVEAIASP